MPDESTASASSAGTIPSYVAAAPSYPGVYGEVPDFNGDHAPDGDIDGQTSDAASTTTATRLRNRRLPIRILTVGGNPSDYLTCHGDNSPHTRSHTGLPHKTDFHTPEVTETVRGTRR